MDKNERVFISNQMNVKQTDENRADYLLPFEPARPVSLTMNFPQHPVPLTRVPVVEDQPTDTPLVSASHRCNHIVTDPNACLDCMSTVFAPTYAPFAAFSS